MMLILSLFQLVFKFLNVSYWCWRISTWMKFRKGPVEVPIFQDNLNLSLEIPPYQMGNVYLAYLLTTYIAAFFAFVIPWGALLVAICTLLGYFIDKCQLTKQSTLNTHYSYDMST